MTHDYVAIEARRRQVQGRLDSLKSQRERNERGQFATPPFLAQQMAEYVRELWKERLDRIRFLDPAVGTGSLYSALRATVTQDAIVGATGVELDDVVADASTELWAETGLNVLKADFTRLTPPDDKARFNLILTNPPYVRHHHLDRFEKLRLKRLSAGALGGQINGLAGLYCYFMLLSHNWLAPDGLGVWLIPSEFMNVNYGQALRHYLTTKVTLLRIHRFDPEELQFDDALVSSAIVVLRKAVPDVSHEPILSYGGLLIQPRQEERVALPDLVHSHKWSALPTADRRVGTAAMPKTVTLSDVFSVKRGVATGANSFFVLPKDEAARRGITDRFLKPILPSPRYLNQAVVESDNGGYPLIDRPLALIDTDLPREEIKRLCPPLWDYLKEGERAGLKDKYLLAKRSPWYKQEYRAPAPFLCTYMGRGGNERHPFRFFWNKSQAVAPNVYLLLYPAGALGETLRTSPQHLRTVFDLLQSIDPAALIKEGRVYGGGLYKLEPRELGRVSALDFVEKFGLRIEPAAIQGSLALS